MMFSAGVAYKPARHVVERESREGETVVSERFNHFVNFDAEPVRVEPETFKFFS
jgi:hypothetical protein